MEFFCYHRDRPGSGALRAELVERHWSYMDGFASELIARGPTLDDDGGAATGSVHIVDLPDTGAARRFALDEPGYQAGVYREVLLAVGATCSERPCRTFQTTGPTAGAT